MHTAGFGRDRLPVAVWIIRRVGHWAEEDRRVGAKAREGGAVPDNKKSWP